MDVADEAQPVQSCIWSRKSIDLESALNLNEALVQGNQGTDSVIAEFEYFNSHQKGARDPGQ